MPKRSAPRYQLLANELSRLILDGTLPPGSILPSESELSEQHGISRASVRAAIRELVTAGMVDVSQGRGAFVRIPRAKVRRHPTSRYVWEKEQAGKADSERQETSITDYDAGLQHDDVEDVAIYDTVPADVDLATRFQVPPGTRLLRRRYEHRPHLEDAPLSLITSYQPWDQAARNPDLLDASKEPWPGGTIHQLSTIGIEVMRFIDEVTARPPTIDEAGKLNLPDGTSVFLIRKVAVDADNNVVDITDAVLPGDRTELIYEIDLPAWATPPLQP